MADSRSIPISSSSSTACGHTRSISKAATRAPTLSMVDPAAGPHAHHAHHATAASSTLGTTLLATTLHTTGYLAITGVVGLVVFEKLGLGLLRKAWLNTDLMWAAALVITGLSTMLV
jgi:hypothetical protein